MLPNLFGAPVAQVLIERLMGLIGPTSPAGNLLGGMVGVNVLPCPNGIDTGKDDVLEQRVEHLVDFAGHGLRARQDDLVELATPHEPGLRTSHLRNVEQRRNYHFAVVLECPKLPGCREAVEERSKFRNLSDFDAHLWRSLPLVANGMDQILRIGYEESRKWEWISGHVQVLLAHFLRDSSIA